MQGTISQDRADRADEIRAHLHEVLKSPHFRGSKRCQGLLTFLVEKAIEGHHDALKERVIGTEVFNRASGYDPAVDPVVRVTAAEVRKRLAQFYQENPDRAPRAPCFRIATGGYVPEFYSPTTVEPVSPPTIASRENQKWRLPAALVLAAALGAACLILWTPRSALARFWGPAFNSRRPPVIVMELYGAKGLVDRLRAELDRDRLSERAPVAVGDIEATLGQAAMLGNLYAIQDLDRVFVAKGQPPELRVGAELYTSDLAERPVILIGYFNNPWTKDLDCGHLRFTLFNERAATGFVDGIRDNLNPGKTWAITSDRGWFTDTPVSYAVVTRLFQPHPARFLVSVAGITHRGTQAAGDFITGEPYLAEFERQAPSDWEHKNLQIVLETHIVNQTPTPPTIIASHFW